jgi:hypothetical protein
LEIFSIHEYRIGSGFLYKSVRIFRNAEAIEKIDMFQVSASLVISSLIVDLLGALCLFSR